MRIGIPKERKVREYRVACTPGGVRELVDAGHDVLVEAGLGIGSGFSDDEFKLAGAVMLPGAQEVWGEAEMVLKVKEPTPDEYRFLRRDLVLFTYLHLAASWSCTEALLQGGTSAIAYETVQNIDGSLPLLAPMSEVAGRMAAQVGAYYLQRHGDFGRGVLMGGVPGTRGANVVVLGAGISGTNAAVIARGMGAAVTILDIDIDKLRSLDRTFGSDLRTIVSNRTELEHAICDADLVVGAVLLAGARAPKLVSDELVAQMKPGAVLVDIAIDQGGCFESSRPTTHDDPVFGVADALFYCVANMPGAVPRTSTYALTNATLPFVLDIARRGWKDAMRRNPALARGLNTHDGALTCLPVGEAHGIEVADMQSILA